MFAADGPENTALFFRSLDFVIDDLSSFGKGFGGSGEGFCGSQPQPVLIVYRDNETGLARQIETMKMVILGFQDHGLTATKIVFLSPEGK